MFPLIEPAGDNGADADAEDPAVDADDVALGWDVTDALVQAAVAATKTSPTAAIDDDLIPGASSEGGWPQHCSSPVPTCCMIHAAI
jgi:hypothetical protein